MLTLNEIISIESYTDDDGVRHTLLTYREDDNTFSACSCTRPVVTKRPARFPESAIQRIDIFTDSNGDTHTSATFETEEGYVYCYCSCFVGRERA